MKPTLVVICGPTAVGKTQLAIELALHWNAEIFSADSRQFYKEMNIGTAKPSPEQLQRVPHHFINHLSIHDSYSAGQYEKEAVERLENYFSAKPLALLVGGSGLFIHAVCNGFDNLEEFSKAKLFEIRNFLNKQSLEWLQRETERLDPEFYQKTDKKNPARLKRALEVIYVSGKKFSSMHTGMKAIRPFRIIKIGLMLPRNLLYERIHERTLHMMKNGLIEEAAHLYKYRNLQPLNTVGYKEVFQYLEGTLSLDEVAPLIEKNTRNYAKRQITWFKKDSSVNWFSPEQKEDIIQFVESFIGNTDDTP
ncbi:MAG: tRNA (adenosine(37)-N6)-dimethylallyltransferase MiaA [Chitinophagales bacterium]|nr:tRNA (adenosine(37)-N6)-dimethylallyltransferase MiaA [Chitinophagales bacterium]MDW8274375.1 tRNA (adenosine(37)-N6)-dimethylallyltransferase MiaA [Chitinophagales bacterium]